MSKAEIELKKACEVIKELRLMVEAEKLKKELTNQKRYLKYKDKCQARYVKKASELIECTVCKKTIKKMSFETHLKSRKHIEKKKLQILSEAEKMVSENILNENPIKENI